MGNKTIQLKSINSIASKASAKLKRHSPEILIAAGVVGVVASAVLACKATTKISTIIEEAKGNIDQIHECSKNEKFETQYTSEDVRKNLTIIYVQTAVKMIKLYAPAVILGALSITSILSSNNILRKRNVALVAAYTAVDRSFKGYRSRVIDRFGEQVDKEMKYGIKAKKFEEVQIDPETGKEKKIKKTVNVVDPNICNDYAVYFDESCKSFEKNNDDYNEFFLRGQQSYFNDRLVATGHVFLNEIYEALGIPHTKMGQITGWIYDPKDPEKNGDGYIDFRIFHVNRETADGRYEPAILLDFNVDGPIIDLI